MPDSLWSEYKNNEGRTYWSNSKTKQSVWEKPDELRTPFERALAKTDWKQYTSKDRPYYVNSWTKETKWELPDELVRLKSKVEREEAYQEEREMRKAKGLPSPTPPPRTPSPSPEPTSGNAMVSYSAPAPPRAKTPPPKWPVGGFLKYEAAENAFMKLLAFYDVDERSTWEETLRKIVTHELYKALDSIAEKKAAFTKYQRKIVDDREAAKTQRMEKLRPALHGLFAVSGAIKSWSTAQTADKVFVRERVWQSAKQDEREAILEAYTRDLRLREETEARETRDRNIQTLSSLIRTLDITVSTRWRQAHDLVVSSKAFKADPDLEKIDTVDILDVYDSYSKELEKEHEEESRKLRIQKIREARKARDGFKELLHDLRERGELTSTTRWNDLYPSIRSDERYLALLGKSGSNPLDLWMDAVDDLSEEVDRAADKITKGFGEAGKNIEAETSWEDFESWVKEAHLDTMIDVKLRREVHSMITNKIKQAAADEIRRAERKRRHRIDDLRYAMKTTKVTVDMTYEEALPLIQDLAEFKDIEVEDDRKSAFDKYIRRLKEKIQEAAEAEAESSRRESKRRDVGEDDPMDGRRGDERRKDKYRDDGDRRKYDRDGGSGRRDERRGDTYRDERRDRDYRGDRKRESRVGRGSIEVEDRDYKRRRMSSAAASGAGDEKEAGEVEEGEI